MRTTYRLLFLLPLFVLASCSERSQLPGKSFEGRIVQKITVSGGNLLDDTTTPPKTITAPPQKIPMAGGASMSVTMFTKGDKVAYDVALMGFPIQLHAIIDRNARTITFLAPNKVAYVTDLRAIDSKRPAIDDTINSHQNLLDSLQQHLPKPTGNKKVINGLACEEYRTVIAGNEMTLWLTQDPRLKFYDILRDALLGKQRTGLGGMEQVMAILAPIVGDGHVPVSTEMSKNGKIFMKSELVEMSEEKVSDDVFEIPKGYTIQKETPDAKNKPMPSAPEKNDK